MFLYPLQQTLFNQPFNNNPTMIKTLNKMLMLMAAALLVMTSCEKDDEIIYLMPESSQTETTTDKMDISGNYVGTLKPVGFSDSPARAYVTLTRLSSSSVRVTSLICEEFGLDMDPVNLTVTKKADGSYSLQSETTKSIQGDYFRGYLTLTFSNALATFYFSGTID